MKYLVLLSFVCVILAVVLADETTEKACEAGQTKLEVCNSCRCINGGWACTRKKCVEKRDAECEHGQTKLDVCNNCRCIKGEWACTKKKCVEKRETQCEPGKSFPAPDGCNTCTCSTDGKRAACTLKACI